MDTKFDFAETASNIVYVRAVMVDDLPSDVQAQVEGAEMLYAVHRPNGAPLALVADRSKAFELARDNNFEPVSVH